MIWTPELAGTRAAGALCAAIAVAAGACVSDAHLPSTTVAPAGRCELAAGTQGAGREHCATGASTARRLKSLAVAEAGRSRQSKNIPADSITGTILEVRLEVNLVMLSCGADDGVERGMMFTVYYGEHYRGTVEVEKVFSDMASARIVGLKNWHPRKGDNVTTLAW